MGLSYAHPNQEGENNNLIGAIMKNSIVSGVYMENSIPVELIKKIMRNDTQGMLVALAHGTGIDAKTATALPATCVIEQMLKVKTDEIVLLPAVWITMIYALVHECETDLKDVDLLDWDQSEKDFDDISQGDMELAALMMIKEMISGKLSKDEAEPLIKVGLWKALQDNCELFDREINFPSLEVGELMSLNVMAEKLGKSEKVIKEELKKYEASKRLSSKISWKYPPQKAIDILMSEHGRNMQAVKKALKVTKVSDKRVVKRLLEDAKKIMKETKKEYGETNLTYCLMLVGRVRADVSNIVHSDVAEEHPDLLDRALDLISTQNKETGK